MKKYSEEEKEKYVRGFKRGHFHKNPLDNPFKSMYYITTLEKYFSKILNRIATISVAKIQKIKIYNLDCNRIVNKNSKI